MSDVVGASVEARRVHSAQHALCDDAELAHPYPRRASPALDGLPGQSRHVGHEVLSDRIE